MKALNIFQINLFYTIYFIFKYKEKIAPPTLHSLSTLKRKEEDLIEPFYRKKRTQFNIDYRGPNLWNKLAHDHS